MFNFFKKGNAGPSIPPISEGYLDFRNRITNQKPEGNGIQPSQTLPNVWGLLVENSGRFPIKLTISTVITADGTTSIYGSRGLADLGIGALPPIAEISKVMLQEAEKLYQTMAPTTDFPIAPFGISHIFAFTFSGAYKAVVKNKEADKHALSKILTSYNVLLYRNRMLAKNKDIYHKL